MDERQEKPHDVLAAEEFGIGTRDDRYPSDPSGIQEPHDVLAAEEFAMPAAGDFRPEDGFRVRNMAPPILLVALVALLVLRRRRERPSARGSPTGRGPRPHPPRRWR